MQGKWDLVISDNRYGLYHSEIPCIILTHQLGIISSMGKYIDKLFIKYTYRWFNNFKQVWVPDGASENNLSGYLSRPDILPNNLKFIGPLSRFKKTEMKPEHILVLLSGPEPQRSILEKKLINELPHLKGTILFVRGLPAQTKTIPNTSQTTFHNYLSSDELEMAIAKAHFVICRSGYSTIMDLVCMGKKAVLIPTPGQTEQLYLAKYHKTKGWFIEMNQNKLNLSIVENLIDLSKGPDASIDFYAYEKALASIGIQ